MARWALAVVLVLVAGCSPSAVESDLVRLESTLDAVEAELAGD